MTMREAQAFSLAAAGLLLQLVFPLFFQLVGFGVGDVAELLDAAGIDFRGEDAIVLVDHDVDDRLELAGKQAVAAEGDEELALLVEDLDAVLLAVGDPD